MKHIIFISLIALVTFSLPVQAEINKDNWTLHPDIVKIREIYKDVVTKIENGELRNQIKSCHTDNGNVMVKATIYRNRGIVEMYAYGAGTEDASTEGKYYYYKGNLVFTFISQKSTRGHSETRVYFDPKTKVIYENGRVLEGESVKDVLPKKILSPNEHFESQCT